MDRWSARSSTTTTSAVISQVLGEGNAAADGFVGEKRRHDTVTTAALSVIQQIRWHFSGSAWVWGESENDVDNSSYKGVIGSAAGL